MILTTNLKNVGFKNKRRGNYLQSCLQFTRMKEIVK